MKFKSRHVLITGATSGIGKATARLFLEQGASVAVNFHSDDEKKERTEEEFRTLLKESGQDEKQLLMVKADISDEKQVTHMFDQVLRSFGTLDILINNAGVQSEKPSHELSLEDLMKDLSINLLGTTLCSLAALRHFVKNGVKGCILNNTSVHERIPKPQFLPYSMAKGGLRNMTRTLALEYASRGIRVNSIAPGVVETPMNQELEDAEVRKNILEHIPQERVISPEEVARAFLYFASDEARNITGQTLFIDSGLTLYPAFIDNWSSP